MSVLNRIAHFQNRRDEVPNQELARDLAERKDREGIREIAENLWNKDKNIRANCVKVLYEIGYIDPSLIADYAEDYLRLLKSRNNRLVWGGMIALSTVATLKADVIFEHLQEVYRAIEGGSVITVDGGVLTLAGAASACEEYRQTIFPFLLDHLRTCRPKDVPQHSEKCLPAVDASNKDDFIAVLEKRMGDLTDPQVKRVKKVIQEAASC
ncbi:MAG: hypothetical protein JW963_23575 [Anaerolineales bacterium]|nr:hypothetical protein [Anaerolineales bacterium]